MAVGTGLAQTRRRALTRAEQGKALSLDEVEALLLARDADLERAMGAAGKLRDLGWGDTVTYSRKVFIPLTMLCRDHCHYCTFAKPPAKLDHHPYLSLEEVVAIAEAGRALGCKEALFTLGDRPEERYPLARTWLANRGYRTTLEYVRAAAVRVLEETGLLPHLNPGVMSYEELARLKHVSASMGLMLETSSDRLSEKGGPHVGSPDKVPFVRLRTIEDAGRLAIPFTTGILVGIGETPRERGESLFAIRDLHRRYRHVQEVIVQNFGAEGLGVDGQRPAPIPWQDPEVSWRPRTIALTFSKHQGAGLRADADVVYGELEAVDNDVTRAWSAARVDAARLDADVRAALAKAAEHRPITDAEALALFRAEGPALGALCRVADELRAEAVGPEVTYVVNRNINFTNVCYVGCRFCAFAQREVDPESYTLTLTEVADKAEEAWSLGATEVCMQGGIHPDLPGTFYLDLVRAVKDRVPGIHLHAFSPMEILNGATKLGISFHEFLTEAKASGLDTIPGTAAEILDDDIRWSLTKGKLPADTWEEIIRTAHALGIRSSSTIMFGHVDAPPHWFAHIRRIESIQADTRGLT